MKKYIDGAIQEGLEKGKKLKGKIPGAKDLLFFSPLVTIANNDIDSIIANLQILLNDPDYATDENLQQKFYRFKQLSGRLSEIENVVIAAINRKTSDDDFVNKLTYEICSEINYPLPAPVASCLSQKYYHIYPYYNLICIPLLESDFLLHIPDIYHELGHPLISIDNPKITEFQNDLGRFNNEVKKYFNTEIRRRELNKLNTELFNPLHIWRDSWIEKWSTEFFCDLFAVYTLGPAYAWSNIHMCTKMSWNIYKLSSFQKTTHPPDNARMLVILKGLSLLGFHKDVKEIDTKWNNFKKIISIEHPQPEYSIALPDDLLQMAAELCLNGTKAIGCDIVTPTSNQKIFTLLNEAWNVFWQNPSTFYLWEHDKMKQLKNNVNKF
jgi:hypothetical protein